MATHSALHDEARRFFADLERELVHALVLRDKRQRTRALRVVVAMVSKEPHALYPHKHYFFIRFNNHKTSFVHHLRLGKPDEPTSRKTTPKQCYERNVAYLQELELTSDHPPKAATKLTPVRHDRSDLANASVRAYAHEAPAYLPMSQLDLDRFTARSKLANYRTFIQHHTRLEMPCTARIDPRWLAAPLELLQHINPPQLQPVLCDAPRLLRLGASIVTNRTDAEMAFRALVQVIVTSDSEPQEAICLDLLCCGWVDIGTTWLIWQAFFTERVVQRHFLHDSSLFFGVRHRTAFLPLGKYIDERKRLEAALPFASPEDGAQLQHVKELYDDLAKTLAYNNQ